MFNLNKKVFLYKKKQISVQQVHHGKKSTEFPDSDPPVQPISVRSWTCTHT